MPNELAVHGVVLGRSLVINNGDTVRPGSYIVYGPTPGVTELSVGHVNEIVAFPDGRRIAGFVVARCHISDLNGIAPYYFPRCLVIHPASVIFLVLEVQYHIKV